MAKKFNLAFPVATVNYDGEKIFALNDKEIYESMEIFHSVGLNGVMLSGYHLEEKSVFDVDAESRRIGDLFRKNGFKITQHHSVCPSFVCNSQSQNDAVERLKRCIDFTANLGAENMVIHAGRVCGHYDTVAEYCQAYQKEVQRIGLDAVLEVNITNLLQAGEYAEKCGVKIALENVDRAEPLCSPELLPRLVEGINHDSVGYCLDSGHAHCFGNDVTAWIKRMKRKIFSTHFHDNRGPAAETLASKEEFLSVSGIDEHLTPGLGTIDWRKVVAALEEYTDLQDITFETNGWQGFERSESYRMAIVFWRMIENKTEKERNQI